METALHSVSVDPNTGIISVKLRKADGEWHRTTIEPGADPAERLSAVNTHLAAMKQPTIKQSDVAAINEGAAPFTALRAQKAQEARERIAAGPRAARR